MKVHTIHRVRVKYTSRALPYWSVELSETRWRARTPMATKFYRWATLHWRAPLVLTSTFPLLAPPRLARAQAAFILLSLIDDGVQAWSHRTLVFLATTRRHLFFVVGRNLRFAGARARRRRACAGSGHSGASAGAGARADPGRSARCLAVAIVYAQAPAAARGVGPGSVVQAPAS